MDRYLVGPAQLAVLPLELFHPGPLLGREAGPLAAVDLGLVDPLAQGLGADAELARHPGDRPEALTPLAAGLEDHADGPLPELGRVPSLERAAAAAVLCHDSMILQAVETPSKSGRFMALAFAVAASALAGSLALLARGGFGRSLNEGTR